SVLQAYDEHQELLKQQEGLKRPAENVNDEETEGKKLKPDVAAPLNTPRSSPLVPRAPSFPPPAFPPPIGPARSPLLYTPWYPVSTEH
ncbi:hypothetical protein FKM82_027369, partial [Ascaphus truei]